MKKALVTSSIKLVLISVVLSFLGWQVWKQDKKSQIEDILEEQKITIIRDDSPCSYPLLRLYDLYDRTDRTLRIGSLNGCLADAIEHLEHFAEIRVVGGKYPCYEVEYGQMLLEVDLKAKSVMPLNEVAEEIFSLEGVHFGSR